MGLEERIVIVDKLTNTEYMLRKYSVHDRPVESPLDATCSG